jgi:hypothetical protein
MGTFTAKQVAEKILRPGEELASAINRLKNWAYEGLLYQGKNALDDGTKLDRPGTGRARKYSIETLVDAFLLDTLIQCTGATATSLAPHLKFLRYHFISPRPETEFVVLSRSAGRTETNYNGIGATFLASTIEASSNEISVVLNVRLLSKRLALKEE